MNRFHRCVTHHHHEVRNGSLQLKNQSMIINCFRAQC
ncbi:Uncharacterised protein [Vibrio cholerae]|nr:Uncharacterised protein [Vibrio cholerae]